MFACSHVKDERRITERSCFSTYEPFKAFKSEDCGFQASDGPMAFISKQTIPEEISALFVSTTLDIEPI